MQIETAHADLPLKSQRNDMMFWPAGEFCMGSDRHYPKERPMHRVRVDGFFIDEMPVANARFAALAAAMHYPTFAGSVPHPRDYPGIRPDMPHVGSPGFRFVIRWGGTYEIA